MRITQYDLELADRIPKLTKEKAFNYDDIVLTESERVAQMMNELYHLNKKAEEHVYVICTNVKLQPYAIFMLSKGNANGSFCGMREILIRALLCGANAIFLIHNHPSGRLDVSKEDISVCQNVKTAVETIGIQFMDSIVVADNGYVSIGLRARGLMYNKEGKNE